MAFPLLYNTLIRILSEIPECNTWATLHMFLNVIIQGSLINCIKQQNCLSQIPPSQQCPQSTSNPNQTYQIFWTCVLYFETSQYDEWVGCTYGTRSHQFCPHSLHTPTSGGLRWHFPPLPPLSGRGASCPPLLPSWKFWMGTAYSQTPWSNTKHTFCKNILWFITSCLLKHSIDALVI